ncbi:hypothetical protein [Pedobacter sp. MR2016-24]|uniref:hypothetical protein n=1 Tax=Pedobacter sp. MR2016-24 TaxID=2994466 RepID=UPI002245C4AE|nr:hypothetical protein [Pedobacter sp. MR2016-24]MCX2486592.1 hypothetical protein [Pedobacter sp. MR2016-24]
MSAQFHKDLKSGQSAENEVASILQQFGYNVTSTQNQMLFEGYDLIVTTPKSKTKYIEVKEDRMADNTGNVAVEIGKKDYDGQLQKSGLSATQSTHMVFKIVGKYDKFYSIKTEALKQLIRDRKADGLLKIVMGGDNQNSKIALLPLIILKKNSKKIN